MKRVIFWLSFIVFIGFIGLICLKDVTGNRAIFNSGTSSYNTVHFFDTTGNCADGTIVNWHDDEVGIEVKTKEFGPIFASEGTYILFEGACPLCN